MKNSNATFPRQKMACYWKSDTILKTAKHTTKKQLS